LIWQEMFTWLVVPSSAVHAAGVSRKDIVVLTVGCVLLLYGWRQGLLLYLIFSSPLKKYSW
jgi:hypothetical protein